MKTESNKPQRLLRLNEVLSIVGVGKSSIYSGVQEGTFPPPINLSRRAVCWPESEIAAWVEARISGKKVTYTPRKSEVKAQLGKSVRLTSCTMHLQFINEMPEVVIEHGSQDGPAYITGAEEISEAANFLQRCVRACK